MTEEEDKLRALQRQVSVLVRQGDEQRAEIRKLRGQLEQQARDFERQTREEREYVAAQLNRIAQSGTWRWGHRLATLRWRITRRPVRNRDAVTQLLDRIATPQLPAPQSEDQGERGSETGANGAGGTQTAELT